MVWKGVSFKEMFYSGISNGADAVKDVRRYGEKMSYTGIGDVYFTRKTAELMSDRYAILKILADPMRFLKKSLKKSGFLRNHERITLHVAMT